MRLNFERYKDKVYACWVGKNIGGTMGTPYEGRREVQDIKGFVTEKNVVLPNDDLDLQLVWLHAIENIGPYGLDAAKLGEFWLSFIGPCWNEYGIGKNNMRRGLSAPLSGDYKNNWRDSNGAWIRTEIWASLAPACPEIAAKYAIEDAKVDHGSGEGTVAAAFVAAMESAAFAISDIRACIDVGLANIPEESRVARSVRLVIECYESGVDVKEARERILEQNKDIGDGWFEAPSNVGYAVLGLLYGEGDFKKSMIYAINCGDDTDCTGATVGSMLGIIGGTKGIPSDWRGYIGDTIVTVSIIGGVLYGAPKTCTELTGRVAKQAPVMLIANHAEVAFTDGEDELPADIVEKFLADGRVKKQLESLIPYSVSFDLGGYAAGFLCFDGAPDIEANGEKTVRIHFVNNANVYGNIPYFLNLRWLTPEGFTVDGGKRSVYLPAFDSHQNGACDVEFTVKAGERVEPVNRIVLEVTAEGRASAAYVPVVLLG